MLERTEEGGNYRVASALRRTSEGKRPSVLERAPVALENLAAAINAHARFGVLAGFDVSYIEKSPRPGLATTFSTAATLPVHATAIGRVLLAFAPARTTELIISRGLRTYTPATITEPDRLRRSLAATRLSHVAFSRHELALDVCGVATPVFGPGGSVVGALEIIVSDLDGARGALLGALSVSSRTLSREIGGCPYPSPGQRADARTS
jgi:DNA-binding IclR family transcriptional regulator